MTHSSIKTGAGEEAEGPDLVAILRVFWVARWRIVLVTAFFTALAWLYLSQQPTQYMARSKVLFDLQQNNIADMDEVVVSRDYTGSDLQNQVEILRSTALIERVVDKFGLEKDPYFNIALRPAPKSNFDWLAMPPELRKGLENLGIVSPPPPSDAEIDARRQRLAVIERTLAGLRLRPVRGATVIEIGYIASDPRVAARLANAIAEQYIVDQLEGKLEATRSATEWLSERVLQLQEQVEVAEAAVAEAESRQLRDAGQSLEITQAQLTELNALLGSTQAREITLSARTQRLEQALLDGMDIGAVPEFRDSRLIAGYRDEESDLLAQEVALRGRVGEEHPSYLRLQRQIEEVRRNIRTEAKRVVQSTMASRDAAREEIAQLAQRVQSLEEMAQDQSERSIALRQLERKVNASRLLYENFLNRLQETSQQESLQAADARIITPAELPTRPVREGMARLLAAASALGFAMGLLLVQFLHQINTSLRNPEEVERESGLMVLGNIPSIANIGESRRELVTYFREKPSSSLAEAVRNLRTSVLFGAAATPPKVIMITSSLPKEGKSSLAMLLALTSQNMERKTVIVDCDFRLPALSTLMDVDQEKPGILSLMNGTASLTEVLSRDESTGLDILMARRQEARTLLNPADVLSSKRFEDLIADLRKSYDLVVLDTPPVLAVSDPRIAAKLVDAVLYAVRWDVTERGALAQGVKALRAVQAPLIGAVITRINTSKAARYAYDGYGYGYYRNAYDSYYTE